jgi:chemotaxis response regulator CheB
MAASRTSRVDELLRILVVDDFGPFSKAICSFLLGYETLTVVGEAADGTKPLSWLFDSLLTSS